MALIHCPECLKEASAQAKACPHCGYPVSEHPDIGVVVEKDGQLYRKLDADRLIDLDERMPLEELEKKYILYVYTKTGRNKVVTADILKIDRKTLYSKLAKWGIGG